MMTRYVESLNAALHRLMQSDPRVILIGEDLLDPYGGAFKVVKGLSTCYPERVISTPISEAGFTGIATGMAMRGLRPIVEIMFGDFLTLCADQIVNHATKFHWMYNGCVDVPLVIRAPMGGYRGYGATHSQTLEGMFMSVPCLEIVAPSHYHDPGALLKHCVKENAGPTLFIENKLLYPRYLEEQDARGYVGDFNMRSLGKSEFPTVALTMALGEVPDVTLITYGGMAPIATEAARRVFMEDEIIAEVLLPSHVKPIPLNDLLASVCRSGRVVVLEEGARTGGWGAEVAAAISEVAFRELKAPILRLGARDLPIPSAKSMELEILPSIENVTEAIVNVLRYHA
jgi:pyruvate/2-oxoglutarate/acetoin dehydrogenase E1 component